MKSELFSVLPEIIFAEKDAGVIEAEIIKAYEEASGRKLYPADPVRLFLETITLLIVQQRNLIDFSAKQNLLAYAQTWGLDHLGAHLGVYRLQPQKALTTLAFKLSEAQALPCTIPQGTRATHDGEIFWATTTTAIIPPGEIEATATAECSIEGALGNGYLPGQIKKIVDPFPWLQSVKNVTLTAGGADAENDENFRERIQLAPEAFSNAGSKGAYRYWARTAHQNIIDVEVLGPPDTEPGNVELYPLLQGGELPSQEVLDLVDQTCNAEDIRPDTDYVHVLSPVSIKYDLRLTYWIERANSTQATAIQAACEQAISGWLSWQRARLGRDLNPDELIHRLKRVGIKRTEILSPVFTVLSPSQVAIPENIEITFGGLEDG